MTKPIPSAFFAAGKRITFDFWVIGENGKCLYKLAIDEKSVDKFVDAWDSSYDEFREKLVELGLKRFYETKIKYKFEFTEYHQVEVLAGLASLALDVSANGASWSPFQ